MKRVERTVGVRELRAHLSAYLRAVARGETVTIGDRSRRPVARLVPAKETANGEALERLVASGVVQRGVGKPGRAPRVKARPGRRPVSDLVREDRR
jgi:prevent-host-death family protein